MMRIRCQRAGFRKHRFPLLLSCVSCDALRPAWRYRDRASPGCPLLSRSFGQQGNQLQSIMKRTATRLGLLILCGLALTLAGCDPDMYTNPIMPGQSAVFDISFDPNPVYEGYSNTYTFRVIIDEINGVGANIDSIKIEYIGDDGNVWRTDNWDYYDIVRNFGTDRIEAMGRMMTHVQVEDCYYCARQNWLVRADDDRGTHVEDSDNIEFLSR